MFSEQDHEFMQVALAEAQRGAACGEVPVGAVLVFQDKIIAKAHNTTITDSDPSAHAEITVLRKAAKALGNYRLCDSVLYVTLEPCTMCFGAMVHARIGRLVYAASDSKAGPIHNHHFQIENGLAAESSAAILKTFFQARRQLNRIE